MADPWSIARNLLALLIGCAASVVLLEVALRIYNPVESRVRGDRIVLPAKRRYDFRNTTIAGVDSHIVHTKNALGFRGPDLPPEGLSGRLSVVAVGGSTTECFYLSDGHDWAAVLADSLATVFADPWVNNAGLDGHSTRGHRVLLEDFLVDLRPDLVIYLLGINDLGTASRLDHMAVNLRTGLIWTSLEGLVKSLTAYSDVAALGLDLYRVARVWSRGLPHRSLDLRAEGQAIDPAAGGMAELERHRACCLQGYRARVSELVRGSRAAGIEPVLVTQPLLYGAGVDDATGVDLEAILVHGLPGRGRWQILELYNDVVRQVAASASVPLCDLAAELPKSSRLFYDYAHYTNAGAVDVAGILWRCLEPALRQRYPERVVAD